MVTVSLSGDDQQDGVEAQKQAKSTTTAAASVGNLPWVEKYRPSTLDDPISHKDIVSTIDRFIAEDRLPHLLLYGPPGTGKTSTILAAARKMYAPNELSSMLLELNASDDRGIGVVSDQVISFAETRTLSFRAAGERRKLKLILLDEADAMTGDAQNALRRVIERYTDNVRFCLICNYLSKIIPALQSRCTRFRFAPLGKEQIMPRLRHIAAAERVNVTEDGEQALISLAEGDMRRVINVLQSRAMAYDRVTESTVYQCVGHPLKSDVRDIVTWLLNESFEEIYKRVNQLKVAKGLALQDILSEVHFYVIRLAVSQTVKIILLEKMADIEYRLSSGASEKLQLGALIGAFTSARQMITAEAEKENGDDDDEMT